MVGTALAECGVARSDLYIVSKVLVPDLICLALE